MLDLLAQVFRLPLAFFALGVGMADWALRGMQRVTDESVGQALSRGKNGAEAGNDRVELPAGGSAARAPEIVNYTGAREPDADIRREERRAMPDINLSDDMVKLVRYSIVSIKRDEEQILHRDEEIFDDNMSDDAFATWVISKYGDSQGLGSEDRKFLRVSYEVLGRWPKQDREFEKRQIKVLEEIRDRLP